MHDLRLKELALSGDRPACFPDKMLCTFLTHVECWKWWRMVHDGRGNFELGSTVAHSACSGTSGLALLPKILGGRAAAADAAENLRIFDRVVEEHEQGLLREPQLS